MLFTFDNARIDNDDIEGAESKLAPYIQKLRNVSVDKTYSSSESSLYLPFDENHVKDVLALRKKLVTKSLKYVIVVGIGGSNLGTKAVYDALRGYADVIDPEEFPKIIFLDTCNPNFINALEKFFKKRIKKPEEILVNCVIKSGTTIETLFNLQALGNKIPHLEKRLVVTTTEGNDIWNIAQEKEIDCLSIPEMVGGRYSALSAVSLLPLAATGIDITELLEGAMKSEKECLTTNILENPAAISAITIYTHFKRGKIIHTHLYFNPQLESLGKWQRQLMAESLGKDNTGPTPTVAIGSVDLHSTLQLYIGGPKNKFFTFIWPTIQNTDKEKPNLFPEIVPEIENKSANEIMKAIYDGVKDTYKHEEIPYSEIQLEDISEKSIGEFMQFKMIETMILGTLFGVNAFNQPNIDKYKYETKKTLSEKSNE